MSTMDTPTNSDHTHTLATPLSSPLPVVVMSTTKHSRDSSSVGDSNDWTIQWCKVDSETICNTPAHEKDNDIGWAKH